MSYNVQHGTQHVLDAMMAHGHQVNTIFLCGGGSQNEIFVQAHADVTGNTP
jgi:ribulose kinase